MTLCPYFNGINSIGSCAPQISQTVDVTKTGGSLLATGIYGTVKVVTTGLFLLVGIGRFGRRKSILAAALWMVSATLILRSVLTTHPPADVNVVNRNKSSTS